MQFAFVLTLTILVGDSGLHGLDLFGQSFGLRQAILALAIDEQKPRGIGRGGIGQGREGALAGGIAGVELWKWRMGISYSTGTAFVLSLAVGIALMAGVFQAQQKKAAKGARPAVGIAAFEGPGVPQFEFDPTWPKP